MSEADLTKVPVATATTEPQTPKDHCDESNYHEVALKPQFVATEELKKERERPSEHAIVPIAKRAKKRARNEEKKEKICNLLLRVFLTLSHLNELLHVLSLLPTDMNLTGRSMHIRKLHIQARHRRIPQVQA